MGEKTEITWCDHTLNPWTGCNKISPGCDNCYAAESDHRWHPTAGHWEATGPRQFRTEEYWKNPRKWARAARLAGVRRRVFVASQSDIGERRADLVPHRDRLWREVQATAEDLDYLVLTKRIDQLATMLPWDPFDPTATPWPNVFVGVTTEDAEFAWRRLRVLRQMNVARTFASYEPALGPINFVRLAPPPGVNGETFNAFTYGEGIHGLDWLIAGDESGRRRRPAQADWFRVARDQATAHGCAFHLKQWNGPDGVGLTGERSKGGKIHLPVLSDGPGTEGQAWAEFPEPVVARG